MGLSQFFGKHEELSVGIVVFLFFLFSFAIVSNYYGLLGPHYDKIAVKYSEQGSMLGINENFDINPNGKSYHVLYRSFSEKICMDNSCNIQIKGVSCKTGKPYIAYKNGEPINPLTKASYKTLMKSMFKANEVGCFIEDSTYESLKESMKIDYLVPMEHVESNKNLHYLFSRNHFSIFKLEINGIKGNHESKWLPRDVNVAIDVNTGELKEGGFSFYIALLFALLFTAMPYIVWYFFGREKEFVVPEYLHTIPDKEMEPWQVDVLTNGTFNLSKNGMASILLELYVKKIVEFKEEKKMMIFKDKIFLVRKDASIDGLSVKARTMYYMIKNRQFKEDDKYWYCHMPNDRSELENFFRREDIRPFLKKHINRMGYALMIFVESLVIFVFGFFGIDSLLAYLFWIISFVMVFKMSTVFSRFKNDSYKKYLEWLSFKNMLMDFAQIQKYLKEDYVQWKEWLLYATALGASKNLIKAMKELKFMSLEEIDRVDYVHVMALSMANSMLIASSARSSGAGGIGMGGGFGGGGGGGR